MLSTNGRRKIDEWLTHDINKWSTKDQVSAIHSLKPVRAVWLASRAPAHSTPHGRPGDERSTMGQQMVDERSTKGRRRVDEWSMNGRRTVNGWDEWTDAQGTNVRPMVDKWSTKDRRMVGE